MERKSGMRWSQGIIRDFNNWCEAWIVPWHGRREEGQRSNERNRVKTRKPNAHHAMMCTAMKDYWSILEAAFHCLDGPWFLLFTFAYYCMNLRILHTVCGTYNPWKSLMALNVLKSQQQAWKTIFLQTRVVWSVIISMCFSPAKDWNFLLNKDGGPNHVGNVCSAPVLADIEKESASFGGQRWMSIRDSNTQAISRLKIAERLCLQITWHQV